MASVNLSSYDFDDLKNSLKTYLQGQEIFKDYNFDGSGLSQLLNILATSSQSDAFLANMISNEMWLQSATMRGAAASSAALINYVPRSRVAPVATVNITSTNTTKTTTPPQFVGIPRGTKFITRADNKTYPYVVLDNYTSTRVGSTDTYVANGVRIHQGKLMTFSYVVNTNEIVPYEIPSDKVDLDTLRVYVRANSSSQDPIQYSLASSIVGLKPNSKVFFLEEGYQGNYQLRFGNGLFGNNVSIGNVITFEYLITDGVESNGARVFEIDTSAPIIRKSLVQTVETAGGGDERESLSSIKTIAPRHYVAQDRFLAPPDFLTLLKGRFPIIKDASVWGGQEMDPPLYGRAVISIRPNDGYSLTNQLKTSIQSYIKTKGVVTVTADIIDPEYLFINHNSRILYSVTQTTNPENIRDIVYDAMVAWGEQNVGTFEANYRHSRLEHAIDQSTSDIVSNQTSITLEKRFTPNRTGSRNYNLKYNNPLAVPKSVTESSITSSPFRYKGLVCTFRDLQGILDIISTDLSGVVTTVQKNIGAIDYANGNITILDFYPELIDNSDIRVQAVPEYSDINARHNQIILLNVESLKANLVQA
jgi:hypothetical protein